MASPEYLICLNCETPCYVFEWSGDGAKEALCEACGNDEPENFATPEDYDAMAGA
jgi:hypothetical protein